MFPIILWSWILDPKEKEVVLHCMLIVNTLQYKIKSDLSIGGDTNSIFVEIDQVFFLKFKYNTVLGCDFVWKIRQETIDLLIYSSLL